jgi:hypothetical protein
MENDKVRLSDAVHVISQDEGRRKNLSELFIAPESECNNNKKIGKKSSFSLPDVQNKSFHSVS